MAAVNVDRRWRLDWSAEMRNEITIIGAGLGGLVLARPACERHPPQRSMKPRRGLARGRREACSTSHEHNGKRALRDTGLFDAFLRLVRPGEDAKRVADKDGAILFGNPGDHTSARPEVDRGERVFLAFKVDRRDQSRNGATSGSQGSTAARGASSDYGENLRPAATSEPPRICSQVIPI
jgi:hypothetical protein